MIAGALHEDRHLVRHLSDIGFGSGEDGQGTCLAVLTGAEADVGQVAYEMAVLVQRTGDHLQVNTRTPSALSDSWEEIGDAV